MRILSNEIRRIYTSICNMQAQSISRVNSSRAMVAPLLKHPYFRNQFHPYNIHHRSRLVFAEAENLYPTPSPFQTFWEAKKREKVGTAGFLCYQSTKAISYRPRLTCENYRSGIPKKHIRRTSKTQSFWMWRMGSELHEYCFGAVQQKTNQIGINYLKKRVGTNNAQWWD